MSAGGLSYSGLVNHGKVTLPSVESWGTNMNILRDPPKSIMTRRINKVGETSSITEMIDASGDRACEAIRVYARGVNPSVSVSYSNVGNNGGQRSGGIESGGGRSSKLPYTIMRDGAFRPPVLLQEDLLPLSRMPRNWTSAYSQPGFTDFSRKMRTCGTAATTKEVKTDILHSCIRPTAVYNIEKPLTEPFEVKYVIQPSLKTSVNSGMRAMDVTQRVVKKPTKEVEYNPLHAHAQANFTDIRHVDNNTFHTESYIQETNPHVVVSNASSNKHHTNISDILDLSDMPINREMRNVGRVAPLSGYDKTSYIHEETEMKRSIPVYNVRTNVGNQQVHKRAEYENTIQLQRNMPANNFVANPRLHGFSDHSSRDVRLAPKIQPGGYTIPSQLPMQARSQHSNMGPQDSEKARRNRMISQNMQGRFNKPAPFGRNKVQVY